MHYFMIFLYSASSVHTDNSLKNKWLQIPRWCTY